MPTKNYTICFFLKNELKTYEFHRCRSWSGSTSFVAIGSRCPTVSSTITFSGLVTESTSWSSTGSGPSFRPGLSLECGGDNFWGKVEVVPQVTDTLVGQVPVVMAPGELFLHIATGLQRSQGFDDVQVGHRFELWVLGSMMIFLGNHHTLVEKVLIDG